MYPEHILNIPAWGGQYVPYFYQSRLFESYAGQSAQPIREPCCSDVRAIHGQTDLQPPFRKIESMWSVCVEAAGLGVTLLDLIPEVETQRVCGVYA